MKNEIQKTLIDFMPQIMEDKNVQIKCPKCGKNFLTISDVFLRENRFVRMIDCETCGLHAEVLSNKRN